MRRLCILAVLFIAANTVMLPAEETEAEADQRETAQPAAGAETPEQHAAPSAPPANTGDSVMQNLPSRFRGRAIVLEINARIVEQNQVVVWDEAHTKTTFPGHPVGIKLVGANVVVVAQFTPYIRRSQKFLVAQGQIWMEMPNNQGIRYFTSMQTIPLEFGEPVYFFPLGAAGESDSASIEVMLTMQPQEEN